MIVDPLATAYDLIEKWLAFAEDDHTFNHIENHLITHEEDTNATVIDNQYLKKVELLFKESQLFVDKVCKLCGGLNNHGSSCQTACNEEED